MTQSQPASDFRYWAFISYSHKDKSWGSWLHKALETYRLPKRLVGMPVAAGRIPARLSPVFRDRDELPTASDLGSAIEEALRQSWSLIVICSPESAESSWVNEEVLAFQRLGRGERIHCLIVESGSDVAAPLVFPPALGSHAPRADGRVGEPIAADARPFGDGRSGAKLKLIAGILGIGYDTLVQREHQRRHRNLFTVTCAALALVVVLSVATIIAITSRRDALNQRGHAETLVEFMIGDLRKKLEPDGKLATLDAVGKEALAYYALQKSEDLDAEGLARRARALHMIGEVYDLRGELDEALKVFEQAADSTRELLERDPDNGQRVFDHAQSVYWVGYIAYQRGNAAIAKPAFEDYKRFAEKLVSIDPGNADWQAELGYANSNLGTLLYEQGSLDEAGDIFVSELNSSTKIAKEKPGDFKRQMRTAQANAWLANIRYVQGNLLEARNYRESERDVYRAAIKFDPSNNDGKEALSISERSLGTILLELGEVSNAIAQMKNSLGLALELMMSDPENANWMESAAAAHTSMAYALSVSGDGKNAQEAGANASRLANKLVERDPGVVSWQLRKISALLVLARQVFADGDQENALRMSDEIAQLIVKLPEGQIRNLQRINIQMQSLLLSGEIARASGDSVNASKSWLGILAVSDGSKEPFMPKNQAARAIALSALGREEQAIPIIEKLQFAGYREPGFLQEVRRISDTTN